MQAAALTGLSPEQQHGVPPVILAGRAELLGPQGGGATGHVQARPSTSS